MDKIVKVPTKEILRKFGEQNMDGILKVMKMYYYVIEQNILKGIDEKSTSGWWLSRYKKDIENWELGKTKET